MRAADRVFTLVAAAVVMSATAVLAQTASDAQQATFDHMLHAPVDHDNTFTYVRASVDNRDYEGAIAALERTLAYNPHLPQAKFELGVLYFRLGSYAQAVLHFEDALAESRLDPALRRRIEGYLPAARKQLERSRFTGVLQFGLRYNSNVAGVPGSDVVRAFGLDLPALRRYHNSGDGAFFGLGEIGHVYDFENGRGDSWESQFAGYGALQFRLDPLDVGLVDFSTGPRLALSPELLPGWTIHPYASAGGALIAGRRYSSSYGGGVSFGVPVSDVFTLAPGFEVRRVDVDSFGGQPNRGVLVSGVLWRGYASAGWAIAEGVALAGKAFVGYNAADPGGGSSSHYGFESSIKIDFNPPTDEIGMSWSVTPFARVLLVDFTRADPSVDPLVTRQDRQFRTGAQLDMPINAAFGVSATAQYDRYDSNIRNYRASGGSFLIGPTLRF